MAAHDREIAGLHSGVGSRAHRDTEVGRNQRGGVVHTITHHGDGSAFAPQSLDHGQLVGGQDTRHGVGRVDANFRGHMVNGAFGVTRDDHRLHTEFAKSVDRLTSFRPRFVAYDEPNDRLVIDQCINHRARRTTRRCATNRHTTGFAVDDDDTRHPHTRFVEEFAHSGGVDGDLVIVEMTTHARDDRSRDGMLAVRFHRRDGRQLLTRHRITQGLDLSQGHDSGGEGAGLVEDHRVDGAGGLEHMGAFDDDAFARRTTGTDEKRHRGGQTECTRTGDHENRHRGLERTLAVSGRDQPSDERADGQQHDQGNEHRTDAVGQTLNRGLTVLGSLDQTGHLREHRVTTHASGSHQKSPRRVESSTSDRVAGLHIHRCTLSGDHAAIDRTRTVDHHTIGGHTLAGPNDERLPHSERRDRDLRFDTLAPQSCVTHANGGQCAQRVTGSPA